MEDKIYRGTMVGNGQSIVYKYFSPHVVYKSSSLKSVSCCVSKVFIEVSF